jgi:biopolymer transport protein ExbD
MRKKNIMKYMLLGVILTLVGCATTQQQKDQTIVITNDGYFIGHEVNLEDLSQILKSADNVVLSADKNTKHKRVVSVLDECAAAGITNITFKTTN